LVWKLHTYDGQNIASSLVIIRIDTLDSGVVSVLSLVRVLEEPKEHVDEIDEDISAKHALPEIPRVAHLSQEVEEKHGSSISVDNGIDTLISAEETSATRSITIGGRASECHNRNMAFNCPVGKVRITIWSSSTAERAKHGGEIGGGGGTNTDGHETRNDSRPNTNIRQPPKPLQRPNLSQYHPHNSNNEQANNKAKPIAIGAILADGDLGDGATEREDEDCDQHEHLQ
jgi:hypothetical protein